MSGNEQRFEVPPEYADVYERAYRLAYEEYQNQLAELGAGRESSGRPAEERPDDSPDVEPDATAGDGAKAGMPEKPDSAAAGRRATAASRAAARAGRRRRVDVPEQRVARTPARRVERRAAGTAATPASARQKKEQPAQPAPGRRRAPRTPRQPTTRPGQGPAEAAPSRASRPTVRAAPRPAPAKPRPTVEPPVRSANRYEPSKKVGFGKPLAFLVAVVVLLLAAFLIGRATAQARTASDPRSSDMVSPVQTVPAVQAVRFS